MKTTRRNFLVDCAGGAAALASSRLTNVVFAAEAAPKNTLVLVSLRGGLDSLQLVGPAGDKDYVAARPPQLRVEEEGENKGLHLGKLGGQEFLLHPRAKGLQELYQSKQVAVVEACGLTNGTRSHFEAMDLMERGVADMKDKVMASGWLGRYLNVRKPDALLPGVAISGNLPTSLTGSSFAFALSNPNDFGLDAGKEFEGVLDLFYEGDSPVHRCGKDALKVLAAVRKKLPADENGNPKQYEPAEGVEYPQNELAQSLRSVAQLLKMDVGLEVATADFGGFDTHEGQANLLPELIDQLSQALAAFWNDISAHHNRVTVVVVSEFGRRVKSNESDGTDHGLGGVSLVLGGRVNGGRLFGSWPGLSTEKLDDGADLAVTTDYRSVLLEVLGRQLSAEQAKSVLPGFAPPAKALGLFSA